MRDGKALDEIIAIIVAELGIKQEMFDKTFLYYQNDPISCQALLSARTESTKQLITEKPKFTKD